MPKAETVKLKKKDAHALGLLCYVETELQERMAEYCGGFMGDDATILDRARGEIAAATCAVAFGELADIINAIAFDMADKARQC